MCVPLIVFNNTSLGIVFTFQTNWMDSVEKGKDRLLKLKVLK